MPKKSFYALVLLSLLAAPCASAHDLTANVPTDRKMPAADPSAEETARWRMEALNDRFGAKIEF